MLTYNRESLENSTKIVSLAKFKEYINVFVFNPNFKMRTFGTPVLRAVPIPNFSAEKGKTIPFQNVNTRHYTKDKKNQNDNENSSDSESYNDAENNLREGDIIGSFLNYPKIYTMNSLLDQIIDNYSDYPIFGYPINKKNKLSEKTQNLATQLLSTPNKSINDESQDNIEWITYGEFGDLVKATAAGLITTDGFSPQIGIDGEFVGILLENSIYYPLAQWSCAYIGAVIIPIDISLDLQIIPLVIQTFKCTSLICSIKTFKNIITKICPSDHLKNVSKIFLFCDDFELNELKSECQDNLNDSNLSNTEINFEKEVSDQIGINFFTLPQIVIQKVNEKPQKPSVKNKTHAEEEEEMSDVEIDHTEFLTSNDIFKQRAPILPDTLCALNVGTGRCGSLKPCHLTHSNLIAAAAGIESCGYKFGRDVYMSVLPMYRACERSLQLAIISHGGCIGFVSNDNEFAEDEIEENENKSKNYKIYNKNEVVEEDEEDEVKVKTKNLFKSINLLRPTILVLSGYEAKYISDEIILNILKQNVFKRLLFDFTFKLAEQAKEGLSSLPWISKTLAIDEYRKMVGGRLRLIITTSSYLSPQVQHNLRIILQIPIIQMYGVTEMGGVCCIQNIDDKEINNIGSPTSSCDIRLRNFNYTVFDVNNGEQGEILVRGPSLFKCYHKNDDITKQYMTEDGWFATGDIGRVLDNGTLEMIDTVNDFYRRRRDSIENGLRNL